MPEDLEAYGLLPWGVLAFLVGVLAFLFIVFILRSPRLKGVLGETRVRAATGLRLSGKKYRSIHNLTLPTPDGTTQVDHVIVSRFGVFVIETKNLTGWIFGDERSRQWTQVIYQNRYRFFNPLRQNYKHVKAVEHSLALQRELVALQARRIRMGGGSG